MSTMLWVPSPDFTSQAKPNIVDFHFPYACMNRTKIVFVISLNLNGINGRSTKGPGGVPPLSPPTQYARLKRT